MLSLLTQGARWLLPKFIAHLIMQRMTNHRFADTTAMDRAILWVTTENYLWVLTVVAITSPIMILEVEIMYQNPTTTQDPEAEFLLP